MGLRRECLRPAVGRARGLPLLPGVQDAPELPGGLRVRRRLLRRRVGGRNRAARRGRVRLEREMGKCRDRLRRCKEGESEDQGLHKKTGDAALTPRPLQITR
jgi:hypothetical protein